ncbi:hypothetical protein TWF679_004976 [Orbilia oligospora]|uniref:Extracellular serine-rich protein n=1 Tax=Orbilia oligospora TaxID=2813651 RepID=A0A8H8VD03_ORBOL|nr:hypothetical protein TWF679_004976 [Orbilia oligospora]
MANLLDVLLSIYSQLLALQSQIQTATVKSSTTTAKVPSTTSAKITSSTSKLVSTSATAKASISSVRSTVPASSVRSTTTTAKVTSTNSKAASSAASSKAASSSIAIPSAQISSVVNIDSVLSSIASVISTSVLPVASTALPSVEIQNPLSSSVGPGPSAPSADTSSLSSTSTAATPSATYTLLNNVLILAPDQSTAALTEQPLDGYGMAWDTFIVPKEGIELPALTSNNSDGSITCKYNIIAMHSQLSYDYGDLGWRSALTQEQMNQIYAYQVSCNVRMVHFNIWPGNYAFGADAIGGCCDAADVQDVTVIKEVADARFPSAGLNSVPLPLNGLYHVPSKITDTNLTQTTAFLEFGPNLQYAKTTVGGVINTFPDGRSQMAFFCSFGTWSPTSAYLNHIWIHWATHGLYDGYRRALLSTQIDDVLLGTEAWDTGITYRTTVTDMIVHADWVNDVNTRLAKTNPGSHYMVELGLNGNGNVLQSYDQQLLKTSLTGTCQDPIWYARDPDTTPLEFQKALGTGTDSWPTDITEFSLYTLTCLKLDPLSVWLWSTVPARTAYYFVSHTFTHLSLNNATYNDTYREINWNLRYFKATGLDVNTQISQGGLIPPAITGMHNGDALRAMMDNGVWNAVGDNTRPPLRNQESVYWPLFTTVANNGYDGFQITPRFATRIYFNCFSDTSDCTVAEWVATSTAKGDINDLLSFEQETTINSLLNLMHDPYMFHQANMRTNITNLVNIPGTSVTSKFSLLQMWTETQIAEFQRLVTWPLLTYKHDDIATAFKNRYQRDLCYAQVSQGVSQGKVVSITVSTPNNTCPVEIAVTVPGGVKETGSNIRVEKIGNDLPTIWLKLNGQPITLTLSTPLAIGGL